MEYLLKIDYSDIRNRNDYVLVLAIARFDDCVINDQMEFGTVGQDIPSLSFSGIPKKWLIRLVIKQRVGENTVLYRDEYGTRVAIDKGAGGYACGMESKPIKTHRKEKLKEVSDSDLYYTAEVEDKAVEYLGLQSRSPMAVLKYIKMVAKQAFEDSRKLAGLDTPQK